MAPQLTIPSDTVVAAIHGSVTVVTRRVEIYEADATTLWLPSADLVSGNVTLDYTRDERRQFQIQIFNDGSLALDPDAGLWYDKVIIPYRGIKLPDGSTWERKLGEFMIDNIAENRAPSTIDINGRDFTKKMMLSPFQVPLTFTRNQPIDVLIRDIASNAGITKLKIPVTNVSTIVDYVFDGTTSRWTACKQIATDFGYQLYFDWDGYLVLEPMADPYLDQPQYTFQTGSPNGNLANITKKTSDAQLFNSITVIGASTDADIPPVSYTAENHNVDSPTRIERIGLRAAPPFTSSTITTVDQAQNLAEKLLAVSALEQFDVSIDAIVAPYLDVGVTVNYFDPNPSPGEPTQYLLANLTVPFDLSPLQGEVLRVTQVG